MNNIMAESIWKRGTAWTRSVPAAFASAAILFAASAWAQEAFPEAEPLPTDVAGEQTGSEPKEIYATLVDQIKAQKGQHRENIAAIQKALESLAGTKYEGKANKLLANERQAAAKKIYKAALAKAKELGDHADAKLSALMGALGEINQLGAQETSYAAKLKKQIVKEGGEEADIAALEAASAPVVTADAAAGGEAASDLEGPPPIEASDGVAAELAQVNPDGNFILILFDSSFSMHLSDPNRHGLEAVQLLVAMTASTDNLGVIRYGRKAEVVVPMTWLATVERRREVRERVRKIRYGGGTNFNRALTKAANLLGEAGAPPERTAIVLISDGEHTKGGMARDVLRRLLPFVDQKYKISTVALNQEAPPPLLETIARLTGGGHVRLKEPQDFIDALTALTGVTQDYWTYRGKLTTRFKVVPQTQRLAFIAFKPSRDARIESAINTLSTNGTAGADDGVYRYPRKPRKSAQFDVLALSEPAAGEYELQLRGGIEQGLALMQPPYRLVIDKSTNQTVYLGERLRLTMAAEIDEGLDPSLLDDFRDPDNLYVDAAIVRKRDGRTIGVIRLQPLAQGEGESQNRVLLRGAALVLPALAPDVKEETYLVDVLSELGLKQDGPRWMRRKEFSVKVVADKAPIRLVLSKGEAEFGRRWVDGGELSGTMQVTLQGQEEVEVAVVPSSGAISARPASFKLAPEASVEVSYTVRPQELQPGDLDLQLTFTSKGVITGRLLPDAWFKLSGTLYRLAGLDPEGKLVLAEAQVGMTSDNQLSLALEPAGEMQLAAGDLEGPTTLKPSLDTKEMRLTVDVPTTAQPGDYQGTLAATFPTLPDLPARDIPVALKVMPPVAGLTVQPAALTVVATQNGWTSADMQLLYTFIDEAILKRTPQDLAGVNTAFKIDAAFSIMVEPANDWDGQTLKPAQTTTLRYKVFIQADLPNGEYKGELILRSVYQGQVQQKVSVPVTVRIERKLQ